MHRQKRLGRRRATSSPVHARVRGEVQRACPARSLLPLISLDLNLHELLSGRAFFYPLVRPAGRFRGWLGRGDLAPMIRQVVSVTADFFSAISVGIPAFSNEPSACERDRFTGGIDCIADGSEASYDSASVAGVEALADLGPLAVSR